MKGRLTLVVLTTLSILSGCAGQRSVQQLSDRGHAAFNRGDYASAVDEFEQITARYPGDWRAQYMLGRSLLEEGRVTEAMRALEIARTRRPNDPDIADAIAQALLASGNEDALFEFLRERATSTQSVAAWLRFARFSMELRDPDSARLAIETAIQLDAGRTVDPYLLASDLAERVGDTDTAVRRLRQAASIEPGNREVANRLRMLGEVPGPTFAMPPGA